MEQAVEPGAAGVQVLDEAADGGLVREVQGRGLGAERGEGASFAASRPVATTCAPASRRERAAARPEALVAPAIRTVRSVRAATGQASVPRIPAVDSMTPHIFFSRASKNMDSGNSSSSTRSV